MNEKKDYGNDWLAAAKDVFDLTLTPAQRDIIEAIQRPGAKVSAVETDSMGRNMLYALIGVSSVLFKPNLKILFVGKDIKNRFARLEIELSHVLNNMFSRQGIHHSACSTLTSSAIRLIMERVSIRAYRPGIEESLAGDFYEHSLYIVDNAALVSDKAFGILTGSMTEIDNRLLLISEAYRNEGFFYDSQHKHKESGLFHTVRTNAEQTPLVSKGWLDIQKSRLSPPDYRRRILGEFPEV